MFDFYQYVVAVLARIRLRHRFKQSTNGRFTACAGRVLLKGWQKQAHHALKQPRIAEVDMKGLVEDGEIRRVVDQHRAQGRIEVITTFNTRLQDGLTGINHLAGPNRESRLPQRSAEQQYVARYPAVCRACH